MGGDIYLIKIDNYNKCPISPSANLATLYVLFCGVFISIYAVAVAVVVTLLLTLLATAAVTALVVVLIFKFCFKNRTSSGQSDRVKYQGRNNGNEYDGKAEFLDTSVTAGPSRRPPPAAAHRSPPSGPGPVAGRKPPPPRPPMASKPVQM